MPIKQVVINSSPLITLYKSQLEDLLPQLFGTVQVPPVVWTEVTACKDDIAARSLPQSNWAIQTETITINPLVSAWDLGAGESEVISYALANSDYTVMIDDAAARRCAISLNIPTLGTGGAIVLANRRNLIPSVEAPIQDLRDAGLWLSESLVRLLKEQAKD